ncbi:uncharacterized protein [Branchiostoma lanceolatum]|uniref:uncharacterized protein n=1 Tax=Branchiostoma lanceolatum TaxID=7740 RepID=UPI003456A20E
MIFADDMDVSVLYKSAALDLGIQWVGWAAAVAFSTEKFFDLAGSATYALVAYLSLQWGGGHFTRQKVQTTLVLIWAFRLGSYLFMRVLREGKDVRFDEAKRNPAHFLVYWTLQAVWVFITLLPTLILNAKSRDRVLGFQDYLGWFLWAVGILLEAVADHQKSVFKADPENSGKFIQSGLWSISQHPNYLGEITLWLGLYITAAGVMRGWEHISIVSPVFVAFLLLKVSGVPLLDELGMKRWGNNPGYLAYRERTAVLVPFVW